MTTLLSTNPFERQNCLTSALYMPDSPGAMDFVDPTTEDVNKGRKIKYYT